MKKTFVIALSVFALACNNASDKSAKSSSDPSSSTASSGSTDEGIPPGLTKEEFEKAVNLIANDGCLICHKVEEKLTGPSYREVANKYEPTDANIEMLANKIIKGGSGVWGQAVMTPHDTVSLADAKTMVKYILALKNTK
jgi:cytochrome c